MEYKYDKYLCGELKLKPEYNPGDYYDNKRILAGWIREKLNDPSLTPKQVKNLKAHLEIAEYTGD